LAAAIEVLVESWRVIRAWGWPRRVWDIKRIVIREVDDGKPYF
jgi:hypothetical protein